MGLQAADGRLVANCKMTSEWLQQVQSMATLAISDAHTVKVFVGRWGAIKRKLEQIPSQISKLEEISSSVNNALCNELLQNIMKSLVETRDLAERCIEEAFGGKLQMQSSLDALALKLGMHVQECELLVKSGVVRECSVPRTSTGGTAKESVKWSVRDLLARIQIGSVESKLKAMEALLNLMDEDDKVVLVVASQEGGIPTLVHLLDAGVNALREKATAAVYRFAQVDSCEHLLVTEGALASLVRILESGSSYSKEKASSALKNLTCTSENAISVMAHGGASALLEICQTGTPAAQASAVGAIRNLASIPEVQFSVAEEGAIPVLVGLINSGTPLSQEYACDALQSLASSDEHVRQAIIREGAVQALIMYYDSTPSPKGKEVAMGALSNLAASETNIEELLTAGFLSRIVTALRIGLLIEQQSAAAAVCHLARSVELRKMLGSAGCIPPLVRMLEGKTTTSRELAVHAIFNLISVDNNRRAFCKEESSIPKVVQLLDPSVPSVGKKHPILVLLCVSGKKKCRKQMIAARACIYLAKLVEIDTNGARKLLERLEGGKMWSLLRG